MQSPESTRACINVVRCLTNGNGENELRPFINKVMLAVMRLVEWFLIPDVTTH